MPNKNTKSSKIKRPKTRHNLSAEEQKIYEEYLEGRITKAKNFGILLQAVSEHRVNTDKMRKAVLKRHKVLLKKMGKKEWD